MGPGVPSLLEARLIDSVVACLICRFLLCHDPLSLLCRVDSRATGCADEPDAIRKAERVPGTRLEDVAFELPDGRPRLLADEADKSVPEASS